jgi:hypothetical protein
MMLVSGLDCGSDTWQVAGDMKITGSSFIAGDLDGFQWYG